ncbi:hypothetical protein [Carnobacterium maltaromaticum]|uniref:hypothetical protein n=1 Tax=Carnobacterium maltaromaticum TaxID=2751 RepID=UPI001144B5A7|nr:hypothetical protein [Carnobacterium maltaromaticum]GED48941.1 hypothetical protein CMA01_13510 [Carnobacterium maltaromaticum]
MQKTKNVSLNDVAIVLNNLKSSIENTQEVLVALKFVEDWFDNVEVEAESKIEGEAFRVARSVLKMCRYNLGSFNDVDSDEITMIIRSGSDLAKEMKNIQQMFGGESNE